MKRTAGTSGRGKITSCQLCLFVGPRDLCLPICRGLERDVGHVGSV